MSIVLHASAVTAFLALSLTGTTRLRPTRTTLQHVILIAPTRSSYELPLAQNEAAAGRVRTKTLPLGESWPRFSLHKTTTSVIVVPDEKPKLPAEPSLFAPPGIQLTSYALPNLAGLTGARTPSLPVLNGTGSGTEVRSSAKSEFARSDGPGIGVSRGGVGSAVFRVGGGILAPRPVSMPEPEYTEEARQARYEGTCVLGVIVDTDGRTHAVRVEHAIGMGLDEKAIEALKQWRFSPGTRGGQPVAVALSVEVTFRLY